MSEDDRIELEVFLGRKLSLSLTEEEKGILEQLVVEVMDDHALYKELVEYPETVLERKGISAETASELIESIQDLITLPVALQH
jgi:hypothetical protein